MGGDPERRFDHLQRTWEQLGRSDPLWAILTEDDRKGGGWDLTEFWATGSAEFDHWLSWFRDSGATPRGGRALDFGCGVGRMTQAMAPHFDEVVGIDVAPSMIAHAQELNQRGASVRFAVNDRPDLSLFPDGHFDFAYSVLVLQHIRPEFTRRYLAEFARVLAPGGLLAFQLPGEVQRLPADTFRCHLELTTPAPKKFAAGESATIGVRATNTSKHAWSLEKVFAVGNHWRRHGRVVCRDDGRAPLPQLIPGASADVELRVTAPERLGAVDLELDVVAEGIAWFSDHGASTISLAATVVPGTDQSSEAAAHRPAPRMEMHSIPNTEVIAFLRQIGLTVIQTRVSNTASAWIDYWYLAQQPSALGLRPAPRVDYPQAGMFRLRMREVLPLGLRRALRRWIP